LSSHQVLSAVSSALARDCRSSSGEPVLVSSWSSRTARLHRIRFGQHGPDVVVKILNDPGEAAALVPALNGLADILSTDDSGEFFPVSSLGLADAIGGVIMPFVDGASLEQVLQRAHAGQDLSSAAMTGLIARAGRLLARYHARYVEDSAEARNDAWTDLECKTTAVLGLDAHARKLLNPSSVSRSFGDFHPGHLLVVSDGRLAVLDPAAAPQYRFVGRDIACFIDRMVIDVLSPRSVLTGPSRAFSYRDLSTAFIRAYNERSPIPLSRDDRLAIDVYLAALLKRRLQWVSTGRWRALLYYGVTVAYRYRRALKRLQRISPVPGITLH
jgi:hypothetical protein